MPEIIVDTSALVAFFVQSEQHHPAARRYAAQHPSVRWIVLETVFDEFVTWVRAKVSISSSIQVGYILREEHLYVNISDAADAATWEAFWGLWEFAWMTYRSPELVRILRVSPPTSWGVRHSATRNPKEPLPRARRLL